MASVKALKYVFDWSIKQDVMPIFTSEYIPKVMDYYTVSMAQDGDDWLVDGMRDIKTLRIEEEGAAVDFNRSKSTVGIKHFENHTYLSLNNETQHFINTTEEETYREENYLISSNAKLVKFKNIKSNKRYLFEGHVDLKVNFHVMDNCELFSIPQANKIEKKGKSISLEFVGVKKANFSITCK